MSAVVADVSPRYRTSDPGTSQTGAKDITVRAGSQFHRLLNAFLDALDEGKKGLTSAAAANASGLFRPGVCYWKRVSELAAAGMLEAIGEEMEPLTGSTQTVYRITLDGRLALQP